MVGANSQRDFVFGNRLGIFFLPGIGVAEIVVGILVVRLDLERFPIIFDRLGDFAAIGEVKAEVVYAR